jgi:hypothetical protein
MYSFSTFATLTSLLAAINMHGVIAHAAMLKNGVRGMQQNAVTVQLSPPPSGSLEEITGAVKGLESPQNYKGFILLSPDQGIWYDKTHSAAGVPIRADGTFTKAAWMGDPGDANVPFFTVLIVPYNTVLPVVEGIPIPPSLLDVAVARVTVGKFPCLR